MRKKAETHRPVPGITREEEEKQLAEIIGVAQMNLVRTTAHISELSGELYDLMEKYGPKDKEALSLLHNTQSQLKEYERDLLRRQKARKKPYFGRIDFRDAKLPFEESYYVGRVGISLPGEAPLVIDWRAPAASVYYESTAGPCSYVVKDEGICEINLRRKRTYEIADDRLIDFYDSDVVANDELLTQYLAKNKGAVLGEIIATIQKEQNELIRRSPKTSMIVQGVAGSGKTTVAMHRISYILYNYGDEFHPEDFYIIGSNRILLNYITSVLPDLDVYGISQMTMEQLFVRLLYEAWDNGRDTIAPLDKTDRQAVIRGTFAWFHDLEMFCAAYEDARIPQEDICLEESGTLIFEKKSIQRYLHENRSVSMQNKILMLNEMLLARLENELSGKYVSFSEEKKKELRRRYRHYFGKKEWKGSVADVYREFLQTQAKAGKCVSFPDHAYDVYDLAAMAYLYKRIGETEPVQEARHMIIDEAQDFGMMVYGALAYCLKGCTYTIMGDVSQNIYHGYGLEDWKELQELMLTGTFDTFGLLKKSYRNTIEIAGFATEILRHGNFSIYPVEPVCRHGNPVRVTACADEASLLAETVRTVREWLQDGRETIAIICRDENEAAAVSRSLGRYLTLADSDPETAEFGSGIMVLPVAFTKGLEFDAVLLFNPSSSSWPEEDACVKQLYVAATRALHELAVLHLGDLTGLIAAPVSEEKRMRSLENEVPEKTKRYARKERTTREQERLRAQTGERERSDRESLGPRPIAIRQTAAENKSAVCMPDNPGIAADSPLSRRFGEIPENGSLRPRGHSRIDSSVRIVKKTRKHVELTSRYGILRLTPLSPSILRVQFTQNAAGEPESGQWYYRPPQPPGWNAKEGKNLVEISTEKITVRIDKKTGALQFLNRNGQLLLAERAEQPRQIDTATRETWVYFDWPRKEKLKAKGILADEFLRMDQKAAYISFGGKTPRMPLLLSGYGYGIGAAAGWNVLCCNIPAYGPYLYADGTAQIDYYFLYDGTPENVSELCREIGMRRKNRPEE